MKYALFGFKGDCRSFLFVFSLQFAYKPLQTLANYQNTELFDL